MFQDIFCEKLKKIKKKLDFSKIFAKIGGWFFFVFFDFFAEDVLKSLLWGPKTIRKKYQDVFEKFANQCLKK